MLPLSRTALGQFPTQDVIFHRRCHSEMERGWRAITAFQNSRCLNSSYRVCHAGRWSVISHLLQVHSINGIFVALLSPKSPCGLLGFNLFLIRKERRNGKEKIQIRLVSFMMRRQIESLWFFKQFHMNDSRPIKRGKSLTFTFSSYLSIVSNIQSESKERASCLIKNLLLGNCFTLGWRFSRAIKLFILHVLLRQTHTTNVLEFYTILL